MENHDVRPVFEQYAERFRPRNLAPPPDGPGFSGAIVLRAETDAGVVCLRGWPPGTTDADRVRGLHRLIAHLRANGISVVAVPIPAKTGDSLVSYRGRWWQIEPWMPGRADFSSRPTEPRLRAAARCLATLHRAAATFEPTGPETRWFSSREQDVAPAVAERIERIENWIPERLSQLRERLHAAADAERDFGTTAETVVRAFEQRAPLIAHELRTAMRFRVPTQPCLRDVWRDHVLFEGDAVAAMIDLSACRTDTVAADLSRLFGSLNLDDASAWDVALSAYQEERALSFEERALVPILDRSGVLLSGMTWLARWYASGSDAALPDRAARRVRQIAERLAAR